MQCVHERLTAVLTVVVWQQSSHGVVLCSPGLQPLQPDWGKLVLNLQPEAVARYQQGGQLQMLLLCRLADGQKQSGFSFQSASSRKHSSPGLTKGSHPQYLSPSGAVDGIAGAHWPERESPPWCATPCRPPQCCGLYAQDPCPSMQEMARLKGCGQELNYSRNRSLSSYIYIRERPATIANSFCCNV